MISSKQGDIAAAESHYAEAIRLAPESIESIDAHVNLGQILAQRGDVAGRWAITPRRMRLDPDYRRGE